MNKDATRGGRLMVQLKLESGNELPFVVDTGTAITMFDKSWEPKLGKRLGSIRLENSDGRAEKSETYTAPKLFTLDFPNRTLHLKQTSIGPLN